MIHGWFKAAFTVIRAVVSTFKHYHVNMCKKSDDMSQSSLLKVAAHNLLLQYWYGPKDGHPLSTLLSESFETKSAKNTILKMTPLHYKVMLAWVTYLLIINIKRRVALFVKKGCQRKSSNNSVHSLPSKGCTQWRLCSTYPLPECTEHHLALSRAKVAKLYNVRTVFYRFWICPYV